MRDFANWSLTRQVFVYLALVGVVPLLLVTVPTYLSLSETFVQRTLVDQRELLQSDRQRIVLIQEQVESLIENIAGVELIRTELEQPFEAVTTYRQLATEARVGSILNGYLNVRGIVSIHLFGPRGAHFRVGDTLDFDPDIISHAAPLIEQARQASVRVFWPGIEQNINRRSLTPRVLPAIKILHDIDRETLERVETGVIVVNYSLDHLIDQFAGSMRNVASTQVLLDQQDRVILHSPGALGVDAAVSSAVGVPAGGADDVVEIEGEAWYRVSVPLDRHGWTLLSVTPRDAMLAGFVELRNRTAIAVILAVVVVALISLHFSRSVVAPLDRIAQSFRRINEGDGDVEPLPGGASGELGELTDLFNRFLAGLAERERATQRARESAVVFSVTSEGIMITDHRGVIKLVNPAFTRITGYTADEAVGKNASMLKSGRHDETFYRLQWHHLLRHGHWQGEIYNRRKSGEIYPEWQTISAVRDADGTPTEYVAMFSDITARKHAEQEQARLQREASQSHKLQALGQLTGGIAHDFNNILGIIMGYTSLGLKKYGDSADPKLVEYLKTVMSASERARNLVAQMLTYSRNEGGNVTNIQLAPAIGEHVDMLRSVIPSSISVTFHHDDELPDVAMDGVALQQLVMNLCLNARDAMNGAGMLGLELALMRIDNLECSACHRRVDGEWVELRVADTGSGMTPTVVDHIFEPFFTTKEIGEGVGMGLAVVQGIIQRLNGHVVVESKPGQGTVFRVLFPPATKGGSTVSDDAGAEDRSLVAGGDGRVLIVDDEPELAELMAEALSGYGYHCTVCTDSPKALATFQSAPATFDVLLTDQTMPGLTGLELVEQVRTLRPDIAVVLASGYSDAVDTSRARDLGITYLNKPIAPESLAVAISTALGHGLPGGMPA